MSKKRLFIGLSVFALFLIFVLGVFVYCGKSISVVSDGVVEINMWIMPNSNKPAADLYEVLKDFHAKHKNIKVNITPLDWGAAWPKITTGAISGDVPDIVQLGTTWVSAISYMGALEDLAGKVDQIGGSETFLSAAWKTAGMEGSSAVTAIPWIVDARAMFYRTDVFEMLGISKKDVSTWEGFSAALEKIKNANLVIDGVKIAPLGISGKNDWNVVHNLAPWIWAAGGSFLKSNMVEADLDSDKVVNALDFYTNFVKEGYVPLECLEQNSAQISTAFDNGKYAIVFDGPYKLKGLTTPAQRGGAMDSIAAKKFGILPYPEGPEGRYTFVGGSNLAIFSAGRKKEAAWEVVKYLTTKDAQVHYSRLSGFLPATKEAFGDSYFTRDINRKVYIEAVKYGRAYPAIPSWGLLEPAMMRRFGIMWDNLLQTLK